MKYGTKTIFEKCIFNIYPSSKINRRARAYIYAIVYILDKTGRMSKLNKQNRYLREFKTELAMPASIPQTGGHGNSASIHNVNILAYPEV